MTSLVKDLLARVKTAEDAFVTACQERDAAELALAEERKGRALLARATERINELEAALAELRQAAVAVHAMLYRPAVNWSVDDVATDAERDAICALDALLTETGRRDAESETQIGPTG